MNIRTRIVTSIEGLRSLGSRYDAMVLAAGDAGLFYQLAWLERVWPYYHSRLGGSLRFLIAEQGDDLVALAPLVLRTDDLAHAHRRILGFVGGTWDEIDNWMPAFLFARRDPDEQRTLVAALVEAIAAQPWDLLDLRFVRDTCPSRDALGDRFPALHAAPDRLTTPRARLDAGWASYWAGRSKRLLRMLERGRARAADDGRPIVHEVTTSVSPRDREVVESLHRARQEQVRAAGRPRSSPFEDRHAQRVFWSLIDWAASQGRLRAHWLRIGDRTAAYVIALHHAGTTFAYLNAIDPSAERYHPGSLVLAAMIEHEATTHATRVIDMMIGANLTKSLFATEELANTGLSMVNPRFGSRLRDLWVWAARDVSRRLRRA